MIKKKIKLTFLGTGTGVFVEQWAEYFAKLKNFDVSLITFHEPSPKIKNLKVYKIKSPISLNNYFERKNPLKMLAYALGVFQVRKILKEIKPDILNVHSHYNIYIPFLNAHPIIYTAWGSDVLITPNKNFIFKTLTSLAIKKSDLFTCDAVHVKKALIKLGAERNKVKIILFGTDTKRFKPRSKRDGTWLPFRIISMRGLKPIYDIKTLIKAILYVMKEVPNVKFDIIGEGSDFEMLDKLAVSLGIGTGTTNSLWLYLDLPLTPFTVDFKGWISQRDIPETLNLSDLYVSTSLSDGGLPASAAEAMSCGLPVILTDSKENRKWVKNGVNGFLFPPSDHRALAEKIIYILNNKKLRERIGKANRKVIVEKLDFNNEMEKFRKLCEELN